MDDLIDERPRADGASEGGAARLSGQPLNARLAKPIVTLVLLTVGQGAGLLSLLYLSHSCSTEVFGRLTTGLAIQGYVVLAGTLGLRTVAVRDLARDPSSAGEVWGTLWSLTIIPGALIACCGHFGAGLLIDRSVAEQQMSFYLSLGAWCSMLSVVPLLDSLKKQVHAIAVVTATELGFLGMLRAGWIELRVETLGQALALKWAAASLLQAVVLYRIGRPIRWRFSSSLFYRWRRAAVPLLVTTLLMNLPISGAVVLARYFESAAGTAAIGLAGQLAGGVVLLGGVAVRYIQPVWRDHQSLQDPHTLRRVVVTGAVGLVGWIVMVIALTIVAWAWLPAEYLRGLGTIYLCLLAAILGVLSRVLWIALVAVEREARVMGAYGCGALVFVTVSLLLAPSWGAFGSALGAVAGTASTALWMWLAVRFLFSRAETQRL